MALIFLLASALILSVVSAPFSGLVFLLCLSFFLSLSFALDLWVILLFLCFLCFFLGDELLLALDALLASDSDACALESLPGVGSGAGFGCFKA